MTHNSLSMLRNLALIFFLSGFSALIYQTAWQRVLFTNIGVDLTSITVIISVFMAGLGVGAFFGGRIADQYPKHVLIAFCIFEMGIGLFGLISIHTIHTIQDFFSNSGILATSAIYFTLLLFPTFLMGATLPLLTAFFNRYFRNIGQSIGILYFFNTLGAAIGALTTGYFLFGELGILVTTYVAAVINIFISILIFALYGKKTNE